jgi:methanogenic corrinoid protein MtbC1
MLKASLECLQEVLQEELPATGDDSATRFLQIAIETFDAPPSKESVAKLDEAKCSLADRYLDLVLDGDARAAIDVIVNEGRAQFSIDELCFDVLLHAQSEVGARWHLGELRIAEEHHVTATTQRVLAILNHLSECAPSNGLTVVSAAVSGNAHDIGVRAVAYAFERAGWRSICLGSDSPPAEIANAVQCFAADLVLVSASLSTHLKAVRESVGAVRAGDHPSCKVLVGGLAFRDAPELWKQLQADGYATSAAEAIRLAEKMLAGE